MLLYVERMRHQRHHVCQASPCVPGEPMCVGRASQAPFAGGRSPTQTTREPSRRSQVVTTGPGHSAVVTDDRVRLRRLPRPR